jgi:hypothetical protein
LYVRQFLGNCLPAKSLSVSPALVTMGGCRQRASTVTGRPGCVPPLTRRDLGKTSKLCAARWLSLPFPAAVGRGPTQGGPHRNSGIRSVTAPGLGKGDALTPPPHHLVFRVTPCEAVGSRALPHTVTQGRVAPLPHPFTIWCCGGLPAIRESGPALRSDSGRAMPLPHLLTIWCFGVTPCKAVGCRVRQVDSLPHSAESGPAPCSDLGKGSTLTPPPHHPVFRGDSL